MWRLTKIIAVTVAATLAAYAAYYPFSPAARQERGMRAAGLLEQQLRPRLAADPRFASVEVNVSTYPALSVRGTVASEKALDDLKSIVVLPPEASYGLILKVDVIEAAATRPAD